ncbi:MAG: hypothetical protein AB9856_06385 [Cellulosilyticaceae bacterium]
MKYRYEFSQFVYNSGDKDLIIIMDEKYQMVAQFLMSDVEGYPDYAIETLEEVLNGKSEYEELNGNVCGLEIRKEKTIVYDNLADDGMGNWCEVETKELRELIDIWCNELERFEEHNK